MKWLNSLRSAIQRRRALNELRSLTKGEATDQQWAFKDAIADAREALDRDLRERALELWSQASSRFPDFAMTSAPAFDLLVELRLYDEAEALMNRGLRKYRRGEHFFEGLAFLAYKRGDWNESVARCGVLRKKHPANSKAYLIAAAALSELGRASEAESILLQGIGARPEDVGLRIEYARLAERKEDWTLAIGRWAEVFDNFGHLAGAIGTAKILSKLGRHDEANSALLKILHKAGTEIVVWVTYAEIAESQGDLGEAADRWGRVQKKFPLNSIGYHRSASMLVQLDRHTEAEAVLRAGIERFPNEPLLCIGYAEIAHQAGNWVEASHRWALVQDRFPDRMEVRERGGRALDAIAHRDQAARQQTTEVSLCKVDNFHQNPEPKVQTITDDLSPVAYIDRAKTKIQEGAIDEAHTILLLMLERFPGDRGALENLAKVAERRQDWPSMELYLRQVLQQGRCPWWTYVDLARSLVKQGSPQGAQAILDQAHQEFPDEAAVYAESARVAGVQGEWQRELECWLQVRSCVEAGGGANIPLV